MNTLIHALFFPTDIQQDHALSAGFHCLKSRKNIRVDVVGGKTFQKRTMANTIGAVHSNVTYLGEHKIGVYDYDTPLECNLAWFM